MTNMRKRVLAMTFALAAALGVAGCDMNDPGTTTTTVPGNTTITVPGDITTTIPEDTTTTDPAGS